MPNLRPSRLFLDRSAWSRLLRDPSRPGATSLSVGLGALVGSTPILGVHTWLAALLAGLFRLPPAAALVGSNVSNPLTFIPITLLEIRVGSWLLGRRLPPLDGSWTWERLGPYLGAAWVGTIPVGLGLGALCTVVIYAILRNRGGTPGTSTVSAKEADQPREEKGSRSE